MSEHLPECDDWRIGARRGVRACICDWLRACEQRVTERHNAEHEDDRLAAFQNGYDAATVKERQRSVLLIADAYGKALAAAREAVKAYGEEYGFEYSNMGPAGLYDVAAINLNDAVAAIDALKGEKP